MTGGGAGEEGEPPGLGAVVATLRAFARSSGAARVVLALDQGDELEPAVVECPADGAVTVSEGGRGVEIGDPERFADEPLAAPAVRSLPPFEVDPEQGLVTAPPGGLEQLARGVIELAAAFGGRSVVSATFATRDPGSPLTLAARPGEPPALAIGERQFEVPDGWPDG